MRMHTHNDQRFAKPFAARIHRLAHAADLALMNITFINTAAASTMAEVQRRSMRPS